MDPSYKDLKALLSYQEKYLKVIAPLFEVEKIILEIIESKCS